MRVSFKIGLVLRTRVNIMSPPFSGLHVGAGFSNRFLIQGYKAQKGPMIDHEPSGCRTRTEWFSSSPGKDATV